MAEVVGLIASILGVVPTVLKVSKTISDVANDLGTGGYQLKILATDCRALASLLHRVWKHLRKTKFVGNDCINHLADIIALCTSDINDIDQELIPLLTEPGKEKMSLMQKARWYFAKSRIQTRRATLDSLKLTLSLSLHVLEMVDGDEADEIVQQEIEELVSEARDVKTNFLNAESVDQAVEGAYEAMYADGTSMDTTVESYPIDDLVAENDISSDFSSLTLRSEALPAYSSQIVKLTAQSEFLLIRSFSAERFVRVAEHIKVSKAISVLALQVMSGGHNLRLVEESPPAADQSSGDTTRSYVQQARQNQIRTNPDKEQEFRLEEMREEKRIKLEMTKIKEETSRDVAIESNKEEQITTRLRIEKEANAAAAAAESTLKAKIEEVEAEIRAKVKAEAAASKRKFWFRGR